MPHRDGTRKRRSASPRLSQRVKVEGVPDDRHRRREHKNSSGRDDLRERQRVHEAAPALADASLRKKIKQEPRDRSEHDDSASDRKRELGRNGRERVHDRDDQRRDDQRRDDPRRDDQRRDDQRRDDQRKDDHRRDEQRRQRSDEQRVDRAGASHRHDRERQRVQDSSGGDAATDTQREREMNDRRRLAARQQRQQQSPVGNPFETQSPTESQRFGQPADANEEEEPGDGGGGVEKEQPNFALSGALTEDTNTFRGVVIKYNEPPESRMPRKRWRLYPFKNDEPLPIMHVHRQSAYLLGRQRRIADIPIDHPSCSKQHAVLQYRLVEFERQDGTTGRRVKPYIIDLGSANGTYLNNQRMDAQRYYELRERDVLRFGFSSREYVLLHEGSDTTVVGAAGEEEDEEEEEEPEASAEEMVGEAAKAKEDDLKTKRSVMSKKK
ncbi:smad nuclear-interacting protein 1 [Lampetra planeri]